MSLPDDFLLRFVIPAVAAQVLAVPTTAWLLRRRKARGDQLNGFSVMRAPPHIANVLVAILVFMLAVVAWVLVTKSWKPSDGIALLIGSLLLSVAVLLAVAYVNGVAHEIRPDGLQYVSLWSRRRLLRWVEITELELNQSMNAWRLRTPTDSAWIGQGLSGHGAFAEAVLAHVPSTVIDRTAGTRALLEKSAAALTNDG
jgi:hypothetical protein